MEVNSVVVQCTIDKGKVEVALWGYMYTTCIFNCWLNRVNIRGMLEGAAAEAHV